MSVLGRHVEAGFSLLELLIVVALLGLLAWVGAQVMPGMKQSPVMLRAALTKVLQDARQQSFESGGVVSIACQTLEEKLAELLDDETMRGIGFQCSSEIRSLSDSHAIVFYPDGSSSGGTVSFEMGLPQRLDVDWFTGQMAWE